MSEWQMLPTPPTAAAGCFLCWALEDVMVPIEAIPQDWQDRFVHVPIDFSLVAPHAPASAQVMKGVSFQVLGPVAMCGPCEMLSAMKRWDELVDRVSTKMLPTLLKGAVITDLAAYHAFRQSARDSSRGVIGSLAKWALDRKYATRHDS